MTEWPPTARAFETGAGPIGSQIQSHWLLHCRAVAAKRPPAPPLNRVVVTVCLRRAGAARVGRATRLPRGRAGRRVGGAGGPAPLRTQAAWAPHVRAGLVRWDWLAGRVAPETCSAQDRGRALLLMVLTRDSTVRTCAMYALRADAEV